jgi:hypothetical protein
VITTHFSLDAIKWKSRDENRYFAFEIDYPSVFDSSSALRPHLQIEFTVAALALPSIARPVASFIAELTKTEPEAPQVPCVDPVENAADKLSALIWRVPDRVKIPQDDDPDLARHIHDLAALQPYATTHTDFRRLAIATIQQDENRCERIKGMTLNEKGDLLFEILTANSDYKNEYIRFVQGMSFAAGTVPSFEEAMSRLKKLINDLL